ncbi:MAG: B12-binding domain-containing protein [Candidatus Methanomethylophilaceae archaeon]|nr:B12-binding domain-containing protein [Candidatus Methanomethylophilaceae archaeon]
MSAEMDALIEIVVKGKIKEAKDATQKCLDAGNSPQDIIFTALAGAMEIVGEKYAAKEYFLPQVLLSANTLYQGLNLVLPMLPAGGGAGAGTVVLGVVEGDVHDIGKNIVKAMVTGTGATVIDMGKDVPIKDFVAKAKETKAKIIAESTLMTPTLAGMKEMEKILKEEGLKGQIVTMVGGGATSKEFADQIGADGWTYDAVAASKMATEFLKH